MEREMPRAGPAQWGLSAQIVGLALAAWPLAAALAPDTAGQERWLAVAGGLLWAAAYGLDLARGGVRDGGPTASAAPGSAPLLAVLGAGFGLAVALVRGEEPYVIWFGLALTFALAGIASARRRAPSEGVQLSQVAFLTAMIVPALILQAAALAGCALRSELLALVVLAGTAVPALFAMLASALVHEVRRIGQERVLPWAVLLDQELVLVILVVRWTWGVA